MENAIVKKVKHKIIELYEYLRREGIEIDTDWVLRQYAIYWKQLHLSKYNVPYADSALVYLILRTRYPVTVNEIVKIFQPNSVYDFRKAVSKILSISKKIGRKNNMEIEFPFNVDVYIERFSKKCPQLTSVEFKLCVSSVRNRPDIAFFVCSLKLGCYIEEMKTNNAIIKYYFGDNEKLK